MLPGCCRGANAEWTTALSDNYCVSAGCAGNTNDPNNPDVLKVVDDDYFNNGPFPKLQECQPGCDYQYQCAEGLVCYNRDEYPEDSPFPECCDSKDGSKSDNFCVLANCTPPTPAPTPYSFEAATADGACFSGFNTVDVLGKGKTLMRELQVGDQVLAGSHKYRPVYAFAHLEPTRLAPFLQIHTNATVLEVTEDHLVHVTGTGFVRASSIRVGDLLSGASLVTKIDYIERRGLYAPLTPDGTIVVSDVLASNYIAPQKNSSQYVVLPKPIGTLPFLTQHDIAHGWLAPLRLACEWVSSSFCNQHNEDGMLHYADWGLKLVESTERQSTLAQMVVLVAVLFMTQPYAGYRGNERKTLTAPE